MSICGNSYEKGKTLKYLGSLATNQNVDFKQEIHVIIQSKHFCFPDNWEIKIYKTIILPVVLYGCEAWSLTLREESRLRVFES